MASIAKAAILAPMSGVTDAGARRAALRFGATYVVTEMVAADAYVAAQEEARLRAEGAGQGVHIVQIAGRDPRTLAEAARLAEAAGADVIDINMGCPAKRVVGGFAGSALMREPDLAAALVRATVAAVRVPVTVKMRLGWDEQSRNAPEIARRVVAEGAALATVHGRTRAQFYKGRANWAAVRAVREAVDCPLVVNGDCGSPEDARAMLAASGADAVMVGRAAVGRPWLVGAVAAALRDEDYAPPAADERSDAAIAHLDHLMTTMGASQGLRHARKHLAAYAAAAAQDGFDVPGETAARIVRSDNPTEVLRLLGGLWAATGERKAA